MPLPFAVQMLADIANAFDASNRLREYAQPPPAGIEDIMAKDQIMTPPGIASFLNLKEPRAVTEGAEPRYSLTLIFDKSAQARPEFKAIQQGIDEAIRERWGTKIPPGLMSPFHDGAEKAGTYQGYKAGDIFISPWSKTMPGCVDARRQDILEWSDYWPGWTARAFVIPFAYDRAGKRGASLLLNSVQFLKPGPRLDGRKSAAESFPDDAESEEMV